MDRVLQRRDTAANWSSANPVLAEGELGIITDTKGYKIGDGSTAWNNLEYPANPTQVVNELGDSETAAISQNIANQIDQKLIKLYAFGTDSSQLTDDQVYYNTDSKKLRKRINANLFVDVPFIDGGIYSYNNDLYVWNGTDLIQHINSNLQTQLDNSLIKLVGMGTTSLGNTGVTKVGDKYYSTATKQIWECTEFISSTSFNSVAIPYVDGAIYTCNNELWIYNGTELVRDNAPVYTDIETVDKKIVYLVGCGTMTWGNTGVTKVGDIFYSPTTKKLFICTSYTSSESFQVSEYAYEKNTIYVYNNEQFMYNGVDNLKRLGFNNSDYTLTYIENKKATCNKSSVNPTASYNFLEALTDKVKEMSCKVIWERQRSTSYPAVSIAIVSNPNGIHNQKGENTNISKKSLHLVFTNSSVNIDTYDAGVSTTRHTVSYSSAVNLDGVTEYNIGWKLTDTGITVILPDGTESTFNNSDDGINYNDYCGKYCCYEFFSNTTAADFTKAYITFVKVKDSNDFIIYDNFNRPDGLLVQTPAGFTWYQSSNTEGYNSYE